MKLQDQDNIDIASTVKDVLEGKAVKKENKKDVKEVEEPRKPSGKNGPQTGEDDFKKKHVVKKSGEKEDGTVTKEEEEAKEGGNYKKMKSKSQNKSFKGVRNRLGEEDKAEHEASKEEKEKAESKQEKYRKFFDAALKKFGVNSPAELEGDKKKEFFDYVDKHYDAENEKD